MQIKATRQYSHANANVVSYGGHTKHFSAIRWLEQYKGSTPKYPHVYGSKKLQVYLNTTLPITIKVQMHNKSKFDGHTYVSNVTPKMENSITNFRIYGPELPLGSREGNLATTGGFVSGGHGLQMKTNNGKHGYINTDRNGFVRVIGREAGVGLCQWDGNSEIFRIHYENLSAVKNITNAGRNFIASVNRSHANGNNQSTFRLGRRFEMTSTGLMTGVHSANNHVMYMSTNSRWHNGTWKNVDKGHSTVFALRDNGFQMHISDSVNAGAGSIWRPSLGQRASDHALIVQGRPGSSADIYVIQASQFQSGKNARVTCKVRKKSDQKFEASATMQIQPYHHGAQLTYVAPMKSNFSKSSAAYAAQSLSVQNRYLESNSYRIVPIGAGGDGSCNLGFRKSLEASIF